MRDRETETERDRETETERDGEREKGTVALRIGDNKRDY